MTGGAECKGFSLLKLLIRNKQSAAAKVARREPRLSAEYRA